jgi:hypothetical protein
MTQGKNNSGARNDAGESTQSARNDAWKGVREQKQQSSQSFVMTLPKQKLIAPVIASGCKPRGNPRFHLTP